MLINRHHALTLNPEKYPQANYDVAKRFVKFLKSERGQKVINTYGEKEFGAPLYFLASYRFEE